MLAYSQIYDFCYGGVSIADCKETALLIVLCTSIQFSVFSYSVNHNVTWGIFVCHTATAFRIKRYMSYKFCVIALYKNSLKLSSDC